MGTFEVEFNVDPTVRTLIYLSEAYRLDLLSLLLLYDRYGNDIFYFFFLFAGRKISIPRFSKLVKIQAFAENYPRIKPESLRSKQDKSAYARIKALTTKDNTVKIEHGADDNYGYAEENQLKL